MPRLLLRLSAALFVLALPGQAQEDDASTRHRHAQQGPRFSTDRESPVQLALPDEEPAFQFAVFGDRTGGPAEGVRILAQAVEEVNLVGPDLVLTVGDLVEGYNEAPQWLVQMREYRDIMERLECPWFPVAGNHDVYWRGQGRPPQGEHEALYEEHFGPLWYAFRHKSAWFVVLYSDEGNPDTGQKNFNDPACQRMSPAQLTWLEATLARAAQADHVFVFLHHPRWVGGNYGDDWERVHELLASAGNVTAVFGGHIHHMRYDGPRDGIEYFTLATTGGGQSGVAPQAGYLHHYDLVTVREGGISVVTYPIGSAMNPRQITHEVSADLWTLAESLRPVIEARPSLAADAAMDGTFELRLTNPVRRPIEIQAVPASADSRWLFVPDHQHFTLEPGATRSLQFRVLRRPGTLDPAFRLPELDLAADYLAAESRVELPARRFPLLPDLSHLAAPEQPPVEMALATDGAGAAALVASESFELPEGPLTLEGWVHARAFAARQGWLAKTENSEYGIFLNDGHPTFSVFLGRKYVNAEAPNVTLETDRWQHVAGVFDGRELRLYVDGSLVAQAAGSGERRTNTLPLVIGGDVDGGGRVNSTLDGWTDEVRLSSTARYAGSTFEPARRFENDADTVLLFHMDGALGPWLFDSSPSRAHATLVDAAQVQDETLGGGATPASAPR